MCSVGMHVRVRGTLAGWAPEIPLRVRGRNTSHRVFIGRPACSLGLGVGINIAVCSDVTVADRCSSRYHVPGAV